MQIRGAKVVHGGVEVQELPSPPAASSSKTSPQLFFRNAFPNVGYTKKTPHFVARFCEKKNPAQASKNQSAYNNKKDIGHIYMEYTIYP